MANSELFGLERHFNMAAMIVFTPNFFYLVILQTLLSKAEVGDISRLERTESLQDTSPPGASLDTPGRQVPPTLGQVHPAARCILLVLYLVAYFKRALRDFFNLFCSLCQ